MGIKARLAFVGRTTIPLLYFLAVSLPHHPFSYWLDDAFIRPVGYYSVQHMADVASWILLGVSAAFLIRIAFVHRWGALRHLSILLLLVALMYPTDYYLIVNNIERIHYPQYAMLALLLGLSLRNEMLIFFVTTFAGFVDEFLQFVMDPMKSNYFDFNDIVLNILGAAAGVVLLMGLRKRVTGRTEKEINREVRQEVAKEDKGIERSPVESSLRSSRTFLPRTLLVRGRFLFSTEPSVSSAYEAILGKVFRLSLAIGALVIIVAGLFGRIVPLVEQAKGRSVFAVNNGKLSFIMSFERHDEFWVKSYFGKLFHVLSVGEGLLIITLLCLGTWGAICWLGRRRT